MSAGSGQMMIGNGSGMMNQMGGNVHYQPGGSMHHTSQMSQQMGVNMGTNSTSLPQHMRNPQMMVSLSLRFFFKFKY